MTNYVAFILLYAVFGGIGYGLIYMLPVKIAYSYFPNNKGLVGGIIMASYSLGAIMWSIVAGEIVNPDNE
jgi:MFS family permease